MEVATQLARVAAYTPDREFLVTPGDRYTYGEFDRGVDRVANALRDLGIAPGDRVGVLFGNTDDHLTVFLGGLRRGATVVPLNFRGGPREIAQQVEHDGIDALVVGEAYIDVLEAIHDAVDVDRLVVAGPTDLDARAYDAVLEAAGDDPHDPPPVPDDHVAVLYHTGGTTGVPKTVPWRVGDVERNTRRHAPELGLGPDDVGLTVTPLFHIGSALFGAYLVPFIEGRLVLLDGFSPERTLEWIEREGVTFSLFVPTMMRAILGLDDATIARYDVSSLEALAFTGENLADATKRRIPAVFPNAGVFNVYGATEVGSSVCLRPGTDRGEGCIGYPFPDRAASIRGPDGDVVEAGERGELWVRGIGTPTGYLGMPEVTAERFGRGAAGDWYATGDVAYRDDDGFVHYAGRLDDRIVRGGENIHPSEIEGVLLEHEAVTAAAAFGVPHDVLGEAVAAAVVPAAGRDADADTLLAWCRERLAGYKVPERIVVRDSLPRTDAGKFDRAALADDLGDPA